MMKSVKNCVVGGFFVMVAGLGFGGAAYSLGTSSGAGLLPLDQNEPGMAIEDYLTSEAGIAFSTEAKAALEGVGFKQEFGQHFLGTTCGFAGCSDAYTVTHTFIPKMINSQAIHKSFLVAYDQIGSETDIRVEEIVLEKAAEGESAQLSGSDQVLAVVDAFANLESTQNVAKEFLELHPNGEISSVTISQVDYSCGFAGCSSTYLVSQVFASFQYPFLSEARLHEAYVTLNGTLVLFKEINLSGNE